MERKKRRKGEQKRKPREEKKEKRKNMMIRKEKLQAQASGADIYDSPSGNNLSKPLAG